MNAFLSKLFHDTLSRVLALVLVSVLALLLRADVRSFLGSMLKVPAWLLCGLLLCVVAIVAYAWKQRKDRGRERRLLAVLLEDKLVGRWDWQRGAHVAEFAPNGVVRSANRDTANWRWIEPGKRMLVVEWSAGWIDTLTMSEDFLHLLGKNQDGGEVYAKKMA